MGASASSELVVGIPLGLVYSEQLYTDTKQKYDEDTGEPFKVPVTKLARTFLGKEVPPLDLKVEKSMFGSRYQLWRTYEFMPKPFGVFVAEWYVYIEPDPRKSEDFLKAAIFGMSIGESGRYKPTSIDLLKVTTTVATFQEYLQKENIQAEPKLYLFAALS
jgi:hypothetical protein